MKALKAMPTPRDKPPTAESKAAEERDADSENEADGGEALREAMAGIHMHGSATRSGGGGEISRFHPKDLEVHIQAARTNDAARAKAFAILSGGEKRFTLIGEALRRVCAVPAPASMADFPSVALEEAATNCRVLSLRLPRPCVS